MAETTPSAAARPSRSDEFRTYEERYTNSPEPWDEIARLEPGADRTFASTVRSMVVNAEPAQRAGMEKKLLAALGRPGVTDTGRMFVCRMLALIGSAACVPAVAPLLRDPHTADAARYALDPMADPAVDEAYRGALGRLSGKARAGLIGSIGLRGDAKAVSALAQIKADPGESADVRTAATRALERLNVGV